jgi:hypothetical protein
MRNPKELQFRAEQRQRQRKGVVDIVSDIGIENDQVRNADGLTKRRGRLRGGDRGHNHCGKGKKDSRVFHGFHLNGSSSRLNPVQAQS